MVVSFAALLTMRSSVAAAVCSRLERRGAANRSNAITNAKDTNLRPLEGVKLALCPRMGQISLSVRWNVQYTTAGLC